MNRSESRYFATAARMDEAFLTLLAKKDFEYITVKEICEVAEVNRSTLYLHYETMSDFHYICYRCDSAVCKNATKRNNERCLITSSLSASYLKAGVVWKFADRLRRKKQSVIPAGLLWFIFYGYSVKVYRTE